MLPIEWVDLVEPPPGYVLVERDEVSPQKAGIFLPDSYLNRIRLVTGVVRKSHRNAFSGDGRWIEPGWRVMLTSSAGRSVLFGYTPSEERELWLIEPRAVLMKLSDGISAEDHDASHLRNAKTIHAMMPTVDERWSEGDPEGPQ